MPQTTGAIIALVQIHYLLVVVGIALALIIERFSWRRLQKRRQQRKASPSQLELEGRFQAPEQARRVTRGRPRVARRYNNRERMRRQGEPVVEYFIVVLVIIVFFIGITALGPGGCQNAMPQ